MLEKELSELRVEISRLRNVELENRDILRDLKQHADIQTALNGILQISLLPLSLTEQLQRILELTLEIPWLELVKKGCIFLVKDGTHTLTMAVQVNLPAPLLTMCKEVAYGQCLCGQAAESKTLLFKGCIDEDHHNRPDNMSPHGHYIEPIIAGGELLGVLNLYVQHGHKPQHIEEQFLRAASTAIAGIIQRHELERLSYEDPLTTLPNRRHLSENLEHALLLADRMQKRVAVMFLDLNLFKEVNDRFGHGVGDEVLKQAANRIKECLREMDTLVRSGGDEFVALIEMIDDKQKVINIGKRILDEINQPFTVEGNRLEIGISIGIAFYPDDGEHAQTLLEQADLAMYRAKSAEQSVILYSDIQ